MITDFYETGTFISDNYKQSLNIISTNTPIIEQACLELDLSLNDFDTYLDDERRYLAGLKMDPLVNTLHLDYVKAIDNLAKFRYVICLPLYSILTTLQR